MPVRQAEQPPVLHRLEQALALGARLEPVDGIDVVEQERQVEDLELLGVAVEFRQRRRDELDVPEKQGLEFLGVAEELRAGEDLNGHLAGQLLLGELLELDRRLSFRRVVGDDVAELDDHLRLGGRGEREPEGGSERGEQFHERSPANGQPSAWRDGTGQVNIASAIERRNG